MPALQYTELPPPPALAADVRCLWHMRGPALLAAERTEPIVPDGCLELIFNLGDPFVRSLGSGAEFQPLALVVGQMTGATIIRPSGRVELWGVRLWPWAARAVLGAPASELRDRLEPAADVSPMLTEWRERLGDAPTSAARASLLFALVAERIARRRHAVEREVPALVARVQRSREPLSVRELARGAGLGTRRLQQLFASEVGLAPKQLIRIARFQRALGIARTAPGVSWASVAASAGYFDQSHFVRECRALAASTPGELFAPGDAGLTAAFLDRDTV